MEEVRGCSRWRGRRAVPKRIAHGKPILQKVTGSHQTTQSSKDVKHCLKTHLALGPSFPHSTVSQESILQFFSLFRVLPTWSSTTLSKLSQWGAAKRITLSLLSQPYSRSEQRAGADLVRASSIAMEKAERNWN